MARTFRNVPHYADEEFVEKFRRGHVKMSVRKKDVDGWLYEEVTDAAAKRFVKRERNRRLRRLMKEQDINITE